MSPKWTATLTAALLGLVLGSCAGNSQPERGVSPTNTPAYIDPVATNVWFEVTSFGRRRNEATLVLDNGSKLVIDLSQNAAFDCRVDCWTDVKEKLAAPVTGDRICLYIARAEAGPIYKLWINRDSYGGKVCGPNSGPP